VAAVEVQLRTKTLTSQAKVAKSQTMAQVEEIQVATATAVAPVSTVTQHVQAMHVHSSMAARVAFRTTAETVVSAVEVRLSITRVAAEAATQGVVVVIISQPQPVVAAASTMVKTKTIRPLQIQETATSQYNTTSYLHVQRVVPILQLATTMQKLILTMVRVFCLTGTFTSSAHKTLL
jgi:flagellar basal body P-ring protein FlgI